MEFKSASPRKSLLLLCWLGIAVLLVIADFYSGTFIQFPITYLVPVALASWYSGRWWGLTYALVLPLIRFYFNIALWTVPWTMVEAATNAMIRIVVLVFFALIIDRTAKQTHNLAHEVHLLEGLLPICSHCKKIRDDNNEWNAIEKYISARSAAKFTHGLCPDCMKEFYGVVPGE
jgi:hypothetical protein